MPEPSPKTPDLHPLVLCLRILNGLGKPGQYVWEVGKGLEGEERVAYLRKAIAWLRAKAQEGTYAELPVDFYTFVECDKLLKKKGTLWPRVLAEGAEMNSGRYVEAVLTGAIGVGKTQLAV